MTIFKNNRPGKDWIQAFFRRHAQLSERRPQALWKELAVVTRESLEAWFNEMKAYIDLQNPSLLMSPDRIFNADESGFSVCPKTKKVISETGAKHVYAITSGSRQQVTALACISANGRHLPLSSSSLTRGIQCTTLLRASRKPSLARATMAGSMRACSFDIFIPHLIRERTNTLSSYLLTATPATARWRSQTSAASTA